MLQETSNSFPVKKKQPFSTLTTAEIFHMGIFLMKQHDSLDFFEVHVSLHGISWLQTNTMKLYYKIRWWIAINITDGNQHWQKGFLYIRTSIQFSFSWGVWAYRLVKNKFACLLEKSDMMICDRIRAVKL